MARKPPLRPAATLRLQACLPLLLPALALSFSACTSLKQTLANKECRLTPGHPYDVVAVDLTRHEIKLLWKDETGAPLLTLARARALLSAQGDSIIALTNGGIFTKEYASLGLYVENGRELVPLNEASGWGNFYLKPNGVFYMMRDTARILSTEAYAATGAAPEYALQSGPLLLDGGTIHAAFTPGSTNCRLRSGIGVDAEGRIYVAISNGAVNFYDFARMFRDALQCTHALYLDGALSALDAPLLGRTENSRRRYATFLAVVARR